MSETAEQILAAFDALPLSEQREVAIALLHRTIDGEEGDLPEEALLSAADDLFLELDAAEAADGES